MVPQSSGPQTFAEVSDDLSRTALEWRDRLQQLPVLPTPAGESFSDAVGEHLGSLDYVCRKLKMRTMQCNTLHENFSVCRKLERSSWSYQ